MSKSHHVDHAAQVPVCENKPCNRLHLLTSRTKDTCQDGEPIDFSKLCTFFEGYVAAVSGGGFFAEGVPERASAMSTLLKAAMKQEIRLRFHKHMRVVSRQGTRKCV